ncbi:TPA: dihydroorotate dehydrogenase, partial [Clostridium perfringens]
FVNPKAGIEIIKGLEDFCKKEGLKNINEIVGCIK